MQTRKSVAVLVKIRDTDKLIDTMSPTARAFRVSAVPRITSRTIFLASLQYVVEGEERQVDAFRELVKKSSLTYKP
jgi:hypothetical protein